MELNKIGRMSREQARAVAMFSSKELYWISGRIARADYLLRLTRGFLKALIGPESKHPADVEFVLEQLAEYLGDSELDDQGLE
jgi:hypothetical protein